LAARSASSRVTPLVIVLSLLGLAQRGNEAARLRVGVYQDGPFRLVRTEAGVRVAPDPVDAPFLRFAAEVAGHFDGFVLFARIVPSEGADERLLLPAGVEVVELPDYGSLRRLGAVAHTAIGTARAFWRGLARVDVVWAFGPHPFQLLLVALARLRGRRVVIGVRQDTPEYFRARLPSPRWRPILAAVRAMDGLHRLLARGVPATVVGAANAARYGKGRILEMAPSLVRAADVVPEPPPRDWDGEIGLLTVGRIDTEKNPYLLVEALAALERTHPGRFRVRWVGVGPLADAVARRAAEAGVEDRFELVGYVPFGPELLELYRGAHLFVHVSLTEGVPQVLAEALASGTPVVATDVGGVATALERGGAGLLVPPDDVDALVAAVLRLTEDAELRARLVTRGLELAHGRTLEVEAGRVAAFLRDALENGPAQSRL
jgi:glycosyltransferase involved in cell wall biosynthesis